MKVYLIKLLTQIFCSPDITYLYTLFLMFRKNKRVKDKLWWIQKTWLASQPVPLAIPSLTAASVRGETHPPPPLLWPPRGERLWARPLPSAQQRYASTEPYTGPGRGRTNKVKQSEEPLLKVVQHLYQQKNTHLDKLGN